MKKILFCLLTSSLFLISCKNDPSGKKNAGSGDNPDTTKTVKETGGPDKLQELKESLGNITPLSKEELTTLLPEQLSGVTRSNTDANDGLGALMASADYPLTDSSSVRLEIIDCAGPAGAGLFGTQYMDMLDDVDERDNETSFRVIDFNNYKAFESCMRSRSNDCTFSYFNGSRYLVSLQGKNTGIEILKALAKEIKLK